MWRRLTLILTLAALAGIILILLQPVNIKVLQVALLGCLVGLWLGITVLNLVAEQGLRMSPLPVCASGTLSGCAPDWMGSVGRIR